MDDGLPLSWWDFTPTDLAVPGSFVQPTASTSEEATLVSVFLQAGARAETAERFISGAYSREMIIPYFYPTLARIKFYTGFNEATVQTNDLTQTTFISNLKLEQNVCVLTLEAVSKKYEHMQHLDH